MPTEPHIATLAEVVHTAAEVADPSGADDRVTDLITRFEDRDEPVATVLDDVEQQLAEAWGMIDPEHDSEELRTAVGVATYLAFRRDELDAPRNELIERALKAEEVE